MDEGFDQSRTEDPTPRRREEARRQGRIPLSHDLGSALLIAGAAAVFWLTGPTLGGQMGGWLRNALVWPGPGEFSASHTTLMARWAGGQFLSAVGALLVALLLLSVGTVVLQGGGTVTMQPLAPDWERLSPTRNWSRLLSLESGVRALIAACKVAAILCLAVWFVQSDLDLLAGAGHGTLRSAVSAGWSSMLHLVGWCAGALVALGTADYLFQRIRHEQRLRMTREELKQEQKEDEGDPHLRARIRKLQREAAKQQGLKDVPRATVVLTNPTHFAVALRYERGESDAPRVLAKGTDALARAMARIAKQHGIPVIEQKPLTRLLYRTVDVGREIPVELYQAVAEILAQVYRLQGRN
jgi:flagellar biosynthetic protein FlhB